MIYLVQQTYGICSTLGELQPYSPANKGLAIEFGKSRVSLVTFKEPKHSHEGTCQSQETFPHLYSYSIYLC